MAVDTLGRFSAMLNDSPELRQTLQETVDLILLQVGSEAGVIIFLCDEPTGEMAAAVHRGVPEDHPCLARLLPGQCLCGLAAQRGEEIFSRLGCRDARHVHRWADMPLHQDLSLPLKTRDRVLGVLHLYLTPRREITEGERRLLRVMAGHLSLTMENIRLAAAILEQGTQLRGLNARLAAAEEVERRRLARELHDRVGQSLAVLNLNLSMAQNLLPLGREDRLAARLEACLAQVHQTAEIVRDLMMELRPPMLEDCGLLAALRWEGARFTKMTGIAGKIEGCEPTPRLPLSMELPLFRIAQEALTNVARHAHASQVTVTLEEEGGLVRLVIADDGVGFDLPSPDRLEDRPRWGLMIMKERAAAVGGHCRIESPPEAGTLIVVEVPR